MNEHKCSKCDADLVWVGSIFDGHTQCPHCSQEELATGQEGGAIEISKGLRNPLLVPDRTDPTTYRKLSVGERNALLDGNWGMASGKDYTQEWDHINRRSGRTHGMVLRALGMATSGTPVIILVHNRKMASYVINMIKELGVQNCNTSNLRVRYVEEDPRVFHRNCKVFADHAVYEQRGARHPYGEYLELWEHRYEILR